MKHIIPLVFLLLGLFITDSADATHYMGGEISWECTQQGNFKFTLILYRECYTSNGGGSANYSATVNLTSNAPGFSSITMTRISTEDISPVCDSLGPQITCQGMPNGAANMGAIEKHTYTSDASYPFGVGLTGTPPVTGWTFGYSSCCRNPSANIQGQPAWWIRAVMYPFQSTPVNTCFDNSPVFEKDPNLVVPSGSQHNYNPKTFDPDGDSLHFEWGEPYSAANTPIINYFPGYSYISPLPDSTVHPNNIPASLSPETGKLAFTSYTNGAFLVVTKCTAYRLGKKISETFYEYQMVISDNGGNTPPTDMVSGNYTSFQNSDYYFDVYPGDTVSINYVLLDTNSNTNGASTIIFDISGKNLAEYSDPLNCPDPPCALVPVMHDTSALPGFYSGELRFPVTCDHVKGSNTSYDFYFEFRDDFCPVPGVGSFNVRVNLRDTSLIKSPDMINVVIDSLPHAIVTWSPAIDPNNEFSKYIVYYSTSELGPYFPFDTIYNINQLSTDFWTPYPNNNHTIWFKVSAVGGCNGTFEVAADTTAHALFTMGMENHEIKDQFMIHPNPTDGNFKLKNTDFAGEIEYAIYSSEGAIIKSEKLYLNKGESIDLSVSDQAAGVYFLLIRTDEGSARYKIVHK